MISIVSEKPLLIFDCDGPMADPQYLVNHICMHLGLPPVNVRTTEHFQICDALGIPNEIVDQGFAKARSTFSSDSYHPIWESVEAIETLSLFFDWEVGTARLKGPNSTTKRWSARTYCRHQDRRPIVHHARGQGALFGHLKTGEDKLELCIRRNAFAIVEDNPHEIAYFVKSNAKTIPICVAYPYNESVATDFPEVFRDDWPQIVQHLMCLRA